MRSCAEFLVCLLVSPTRVLMNWRRRDQTGKADAEMVLAWTRGWLWVAIGLCLSFLVWRLLMGPAAAISSAVRAAALLVGLSRCNETLIAFARDAMQWLEGGAPNIWISPAKRIGLVISSYAEVALFFALIPCCLPAKMYNEPLAGDILTAMYFSGATISTIGYGDIHPTQLISRFLAIYEAFSGLFLTIIAIGVYISQITQRDHDTEP